MKYFMVFITTYLCFSALVEKQSRKLLNHEFVLRLKVRSGKTMPEVSLMHLIIFKNMQNISVGDQL